MRRLIIATCLIASICAFHIKKNDFNVKIENVEYRNVPSKYHLGKGGIILPTDVSTVAIFKKIVEDSKAQPRAGTEAILDDYADKIFANLDSLITHDGLDPFQMPDEHAGFSYTLIITYHGELDLTHGWLSDLSTIKRGGDVLADYSTIDKYLEVTVPIAFDDLQFTYDYSAKIMGLGPVGGIAGKVSDVKVEVKIGFDPQTLQLSLDEFYITNSGHIDLNFNGNPLIDWLINLLTDVATSLLKEAILLVVESIIRGGIGDAIDAINGAIDGIFNPTTPAPDTFAAPLFLKY